MSKLNYFKLINKITERFSLELGERDLIINHGRKFIQLVIFLQSGKSAHLSTAAVLKMSVAVVAAL